MVLQFLRTLFLRTRNVHYCTLRAELLMSLHDLDISEICSVDPCHKVGTPAVTGNQWSNTIVSLKSLKPCISAVLYMFFLFSRVFLLCAVTVHVVSRRLHPWEVRGRQAGQRAARLPGWSEEGTRASPRVTDEGMLWVSEQSFSSVMSGWIWRVFVNSRDLSMILCDPFACNTLVLSIMRNLQELLSQDALPRVSRGCTRTQATLETVVWMVWWYWADQQLVAVMW